MFEILQTGGFQQLKLTRVDLDNNPDLRITTFEKCSIAKTNSTVDGLVLAINDSGALKNKEVFSSVKAKEKDPEDETNQNHRSQRNTSNFFDCGPGAIFSDNRALISTTNTYSWWIYSGATTSGTSECREFVYLGR